MSSAPPGTARFTALATAMALVVAVVAVVWVRPWLTPHEPARDVVPLTGFAASDGGRGVSMQIVAHQDDDLYFMNPDVAHDLTAGVATVTVYLTAGESDGRNGTGARPDVNAYARDRDDGARAAYALMALGDPAAAWSRHSVRLRGGVAEVDTLVGAPHVRLVFVATRKEDGWFHDGRLRTLWSGAEDGLDTLVPAGSPAGGPYTYSRGALIGSLVDLLDAYRPTTVRTLDPDPDRQVHDAARPRHTDHGDVSDHQDHTAAALFAWEALRRYTERFPSEVATRAYRGYYNERWPANLGPTERAAKKRVTDAYGAFDRKVGDTALDGPWPRSTNERHPQGDSWLEAGPDGRLNAWAVRGGRIARWTREADGRWTGPTLWAGPGEGILAPALGLARTPDGVLHVFGLRLDPSGGRRDVVTAAEREPGGPLGPWTSLGNPARDGGSGVGVPVAVVDGVGRLHVFARDRSKGVSEFAPGEDPTGWRALGGGDVVEGLAVTTSGDGRVELFGVGRDAVAHWRQDDAGVVTAVAPVPADRPAGPPVVARRTDGGVSVFYGQADTGAVVETTVGGTGGTSGTGGTGGTGTGTTVSQEAAPGARAAIADPVPRLFARTPQGDAPPLTDVVVASGPAVAVDGAGRTVVAGFGPDAKPFAVVADR